MTQNIFRFDLFHLRKLFVVCQITKYLPIKKMIPLNRKERRKIKVMLNPKSMSNNGEPYQYMFFKNIYVFALSCLICVCSCKLFSGGFRMYEFLKLIHPYLYLFICLSICMYVLVLD